jgi:predicted secreted protein
MHKRFLPVLFAVIIFSCSKPAADSTSADSTALEEVATDVDDTTSNGNTDGDYFVPGDSTKAEQEEEVEEMISTHAPVIDVCGFSTDGKYFAFTQIVYGEATDGNGWVFVIDVAKNEWASKPAFINEVYEDLDSGVARKRDSMLVKYKIVHHKNVGKEYNLKEKHTVTINGAPYEVDLRVANLLIDLRVKGNGKDIILQKDKSLPKSRGSVKEYRLNKAYVSGDKIAVFVEYDGELFEGFEGYRYFDRKNIAVTGVIK